VHHRITRRAVSLLAVLAATLGITAISAPAASAAGVACTVKANLPSRIVINRSTTTVKVPLTGCNGSFEYADARVSGGSGMLDYLLYDNTRTAYLTVYDWDVQPGTYRTTDGWGYTHSASDIGWAYTSTVIKFGASITVSPKRFNGVATVPVAVKRYDGNAGGYVPFAAKLVAIYSAPSSVGPWKKVGVVRTNSSGKGTLSYHSSSLRYYQARTSDSTKVFGTKSAVRKAVSSTATTTPTPAPTPKPTPPPTPAPSEPYYANCDAARAAGAAPIYIGQPGYRPALDRDSDGIACE
jgi:hypothetical protein